MLLKESLHQLRLRGMNACAQIDIMLPDLVPRARQTLRDDVHTEAKLSSSHAWMIRYQCVTFGATIILESIHETAEHTAPHSAHFQRAQRDQSTPV